MDRLDRNIRFFGREGQARLSLASVALVGCGGLGSHVAQQFAYLGISKFAVIDNEELDRTNKNRYVTAYDNDPVPGSRKVDLAKRAIQLVNPAAEVIAIHADLRSRSAFDAIIRAEYVVGCLDNDGPRLVLTELCAAYRRPYFDLATEIIPGDPIVFGGRAFVAWGDNGCLVCRGLLDLVEAREFLEGSAAKQDRAALYGVPVDSLGPTGPSVVSINGVVASLSVTEFGVAVSGLRKPNTLLTYRGDLGRVTSNRDPVPQGCYYCGEVYGSGTNSGVERYLQSAAIT